MAGKEENKVIEAADNMQDDSSDDDIEVVPESVDGYWLELGDETPVSFTTLPYVKTDEEIPPSERVIYVRGTQDNGMRLYTRAMAWKLKLNEDLKPTFHLKTEKYWVELLKPRKSYEETIRSIISVAYFLNYVLVNPNESEKAAWSYVKDLFPSWEVAPNRNDLSLHLAIAKHLATVNDDLAHASALQFLDTGLSKKRLASATEVSQSSSGKGMRALDIENDGHDEPERKKGKYDEVDEMNSGEEMDGYGEDEDDDVGDLSETVCCICDNGGTVICCDGPCMRSFHLNKGAGGAADSKCSTLGFSKAEAERMEKFFCPNCKLKEHQCYACGRLGCSDEKAGAAQEVFVCDSAMCGHFYHPQCVAELILKDKLATEQAALADSIREGKGFTCPMHKCFKCGKGEVKEEEDLQFGVCRRCPRVWHRKCLPFPVPNDDESEEEEEDEDEEPQRAWDNLLPNRILVYCERHAIVPNLGTPARNHVKFPQGWLVPVKKVLPEEKKRKLFKPSKDEAGSFKEATRRKASQLSDLDGIKKRKLVSVKPKLEKVSVSKTSSSVILIKGKPVERQDMFSKKMEGSSLVSKLPASRESTLQKLQQQKAKTPVIKAVIIDEATKSMVNDLIDKAKSTVTMEVVLQKQDIPACYRRSKNPDKKYSLFKIESIVKGMRKALETLEGGGSIEDAKAKCSPDFIRFIELCRNDLRVYLSPFLHGARYTSYGRHFTKSEKLEEIVDRLHWYVSPGDMIVDFCCGANEFSLFMRKKLEETGKKCDYKNFDLIQTKNDFNFSKRDWFQVKPDELPDGNRLIMGLNPPFGVKGQLANQFVDHALKFKPKIIVLIVPKETERLDIKRDPYDLIWEDTDLLSGQSFYLPGSVDVNEMPLNDWNVVAPPLFIWSRPDWTPKHKEIAVEKGHVSSSAGSRFVGPPWVPPSRPTSPSTLLNFDTGMNEGSFVPMEIEDEEDRDDYSILFQTSKQEDLFKPAEQDSVSKLDRSSSPKFAQQDLGLKRESVVSSKDDSQKAEPKLAKLSSFKSQDNESKVERSDSVKSKDQNRKLTVSSEAREKENSTSIHPSVKVAEAENLKVVKASIGPMDSVSMQQKQLDQGFSIPLEKPSQDFKLNRDTNKSIKKYDLFKNRPVEGQGHAGSTGKVDQNKLNVQDSQEKARKASERGNDSSRKESRLSDRSEDAHNTRHDRNKDVRSSRHDRVDDARGSRNDRGGEVRASRPGKVEDTRSSRHDREGIHDESLRVSHQQMRGSGKQQRPNSDIDMAGKRSPSRYDKYESRRKSPDRNERHSTRRYSEDRSASSHVSRHGSSTNEQRRASPGKSTQSSVVDLSSFFSTDDRKKEVDDFSRKDPGNFIPEDSKSMWNEREQYIRGNENHLRRGEQLNTNYLSAGLPNSFNDMPSYGLSSDAQMTQLGRHYYENLAASSRRPEAYEMNVSRLYPDVVSLSRQNRQQDYYQSELSREMGGLDRYTGHLREDAFIGSTGSGSLPERSIPAWPSGGPPPNLYKSPYGAPIERQAIPGVDPLRISSQGLDRFLQNPNVQSQYPSSQARYPGSSNQQLGGWFED
ncbi:hypothetical protein KP509_32G022200 [Ceratopteris richardii]|uniref:Zinc finger PHD-type domain-containing protein n=1 Tax=Ceratopteris richardii TaxID=49495 RepID=A0A8T2QRH9_CERRI|nr:hypothetical protein KP509_32G022200 [Ceratopteris richardii]KAH7286772.1 hypothetical protein KP509_32G022200 [Ceratopteris richardii]